MFVEGIRGKDKEGKDMKIKKEIESLKECIDKGHLYQAVSSPGDGLICWKCACCGYETMTRATPEQREIINKYNKLKPERERNEDCT